MVTVNLDSWSTLIDRYGWTNNPGTPGQYHYVTQYGEHVYYHYVYNNPRASPSYYVLVSAPTVGEILIQMNYRAAFDADDPFEDVSEEIDRSYVCLISH